MPAGLRSLPPLRWSADPQAVVAVGQRIYTPANTDSDAPDPRERPYAGWLYLMTDVRTRSGSAVDHLTATVGVIGPASLARQSQDLVHRVLHEHRSRGWDAQLHDEVTLMLGYERAWPGVAAGALGNRRFDLSVRAGGTLGTPLTYASAGAVLRYGSYLPGDLPVTHISLGPPRDGFRGAGAFGWYAWAGVDARAIGRNVFIDGNTFRDSAGVKRKPFGQDVQLGVAAVWPATRVGFTLVQRSPEFKGQGGADRFGQLTVSFAY